MSLTKSAALSYPTHFLKSRGSVIRNNYLRYRTNKATQFARRNDFYALLAKNKAKHVLYRIFRAPVVTQLYRNKEKSKNSHFESLPFL